MSSLVGQHQVSAFTAPVTGGPRSASVVKGNDDANRAGINAHDNDAAIHVQDSDLASRPGFGTVGRKWVTTDSGARYVYYDDGSAWRDLDYVKLSGGTITGAVTISAGGIAVTGNSSVTGTLTVSSTVTVSAGGAAITGNSTIAGSLTVTTAKTTLAATAAGYASLNLPHGTAPSSPANGDVWTTTAGIYARVNGATVGPLVGQANITLPLGNYALGITGAATSIPSGTATVLDISSVASSSGITVDTTGNTFTLPAASAYYLVAVRITGDNSNNPTQLELQVRDTGGTGTWMMQNFPQQSSVGTGIVVCAVGLLPANKTYDIRFFQNGTGAKNWTLTDCHVFQI